MDVGVPVLSRRGGRCLWQCAVTRDGGTDPLWFSVEERFGDLLSASSEAAAVGLLVPAMARGGTLRLRGPIDERLLFHLRGPLQHLLILQLPWLRRIRVEAAGESRRAELAGGVATGFSGGVDSFSVVCDHFVNAVVPSFRITHLLFNHVGAHGKGGWGLFRKRLLRIGPVAERLDLPLVEVDSNLADFHGSPLIHQRNHSVRNAAVAHLLSNGIGRFFYASSYRYEDTRVGESSDSAFTDPLLLPMLSTPATDLLAAGGERTRVEKTLQVAELAEARESLDVCVDPNYEGTVRNCSACWKCLRTMATLEIAGLLPQFGRVFDLGVYSRHRGEFLAGLPESRDPLLREVADFARERGFPLSS